MKKGGSKLGWCLGAPMRALSRACDSACNLYVRGMAGCARRVPTGAVGMGRGYGRSATTMHLRASSERAGDLLRAASKQRRVAAEPADVGAEKKGHLGHAPAPVPLSKKGAAEMGTIAEDAPCEFGAAGCALKLPEPRRRGAAVDGLAARAGGFGTIKTGSEAFARPLV